MSDTQGYRIILASCSPRRRELVKLLGLPYESVDVDTDETAATGSLETDIERIAAVKCLTVRRSRGIGASEIIIGADTVVAMGEERLGKPRDEAEARAMLRRLQGEPHVVYTGVMLIISSPTDAEKVSSVSFCEKTLVRVRRMTEREIDAYIEIGEYKDKAGAYAIQGVFSRHIAGIDGDYNNVVGLPVSSIYRVLKQQGIV